MTPLERVRSALEAAGSRKGPGKDWRCPAHDDKQASLSVTVGDKGGAVLHCHAGCRTEDVIGTIGLGWADLFPTGRNGSSKAEIVATYPYVDEHGQVLYEAVRYFPKGFKRRRPNGHGGWVWSLNANGKPAVRFVLYRLPEVLKAVAAGSVVYVVEGEKDVHALERAGVVATTNLGGVNGAWPPGFSRLLAKTRVVVVADDDPPGRKRAHRVAALIREAGGQVEVVLPAAGKDAADHLAAGLGLDELVPVEAEAEAQAAPSAPSEPGATVPPFEGEQSQEPKRSQATILVEIAEEIGAELFHTDAHDAYATIPVGDHRETWLVKAKPFRRWLSRLFYERSGKAPGSQAVQDALGVLEGKALFEGRPLSVSVRVAEHQGAIWLDLGNDRWEAVEVTAGGWRVVASADVPVRFRRPDGLRPLPTPEPEGTLKDLRRFCNVDDAQWPLVLGYLVAAARPRGPYPVINFLGAHGSAKTTTARAIIRLIDPGKVELRGPPRDERDLAIAASNAHIVGYDNLSKVETWLSDALCRLATGGGFATRELYENTEEALFEYQRPGVLTGIEELAVRGDLADRSLLIDQPAVDEAARRSEEEFWADYRQAQPGMLGALLGAVSTALRDSPKVHLDRLPRMADFALWVVAAAPALDMRPDDFLKAYADNRATANAMAVEASPVAAEVCRLIKKLKSWKGTATELLAALNKNADGSVDRRARAWPKSAKALSDALRRVKPNLAKVGAKVEFDRTTTERVVRLEWVDEAASSASSASSTSPDQPKQHDAGHDAHDAGAPGASCGASSPKTGPDQRKSGPDDAHDAHDAGIPTHSGGTSADPPPLTDADDPERLFSPEPDPRRHTR
jgi:hypothetical protein